MDYSLDYTSDILLGVRELHQLHSAVEHICEKTLLE
jgi:hypothetical protein